MAERLGRRVFLKRGGLVAAGIPLLSSSGLLAACGGADDEKSGGGAAGSIAHLRMPFLLDMQVPDPDIFYEGEGLQLTLSVYESLITYKPGGSSELVPGLATKWAVSDDKLTYTFTLREGVTFHDGTPADAEAWIKSFERRKAVNQGGAYMVADVKKMDAPDATTFVVTLGRPVDPFLDYLACPWAPFATSPTAVAKNAKGDDLAQAWLTTRDAGTGPYVISEFEPGSHYTLTRFDGWWGPKPQVEELVIEIIGDVSTQRLKLEAGELDIVSRGFSIEDIKAFEAKEGFTTVEQVNSVKHSLWLNATGGVFADKKLRQALIKAIDRKAVVEPAFQDKATVSKDFFSATMFPKGKVSDDPGYDTGPLKKLAPSLKQKIDLAYSEGGGAPYRRMAELIQTQLQALGLKVEVRGMPTSQVFALATGPAGDRPDLLLWSMGGDALHVDTVVRIFFRTGAAPLNWAQYTNAQVDKLMDDALVAPTEDQVDDLHAQIGEIVLDEAWVLNLCDPDEVIIARSGITDFQLNSFYPRIFTLAELEMG